MNPAGVEKELPGHQGHGHDPAANGPGASDMLPRAALGYSRGAAERVLLRMPSELCDAPMTFVEVVSKTVSI